eukprot:8097729-Pyramimonas_sp.AAC.1
MPVGMQEMLGAVIDLPRGRVQFTQLGVETPLEKLPSGHRVVSIDRLGPPAEFEAPPAVAA